MLIPPLRIPRHADPIVAARLIDGEFRRGEFRIGEGADGDRDHVGHVVDRVPDGRAANGTEVKARGAAFIAGARPLARLAAEAHLIARPARLRAKDAARAPLAGEAMTHRDAHQFARDGGGDGATRTGGGAFGIGHAAQAILRADADPEPPRPRRERAHISRLGAHRHFSHRTGISGGAVRSLRRHACAVRRQSADRRTVRGIRTYRGADAHRSRHDHDRAGGMALRAHRQRDR